MKVTLIIVFALISGYNVYSSQKSSVMSNLALSNVEALAGGENSGGFDCCDTCSGAYCGYFIDTQGNGTKVYYK